MTLAVIRAADACRPRNAGRPAVGPHGDPRFGGFQAPPLGRVAISTPAAALLRLHDHLRVAVVQASRGRLVGFVAVRIAVAYADVLAAGDLELHRQVRRRHVPSARVQRFDGDRHGVAAVAVECGAIGRQLQPHRRARRLHGRIGHHPPAAPCRPPPAAPADTAPANRSFPIDRPPARRSRPFSRSSHPLGIPHRHHLDRLAFPARPLPMRHQPQHRAVVDPHRLAHVISRLAEAARVHDAEIGTDRRPSKRRRLAAIVEASPHEAAAHERPRRNRLPRDAVGRAPGRGLVVVRGQQCRSSVASTYSPRVMKAEVSSQLISGFVQVGGVISVVGRPAGS